jgi:3-dehydrosphinganine reductase
MKFNGKHAIITGGSSGIGKATARLLVAKGCHVCLIARDAVKLEQARRELAGAKQYPEQKISIASADVSDRVQAEKAIQRAIAELGPPDILIASAGIARPDYVGNLSIEVFERTMAVNYFGSLYCVLEVLKSMETRGTGHIVLLSSGAGLIGLFGYSAYSPSKFAVRGLAESLRGELKFSGIDVSIVYPPDTDTPQLEEENRTKPPETKAITAVAKLWSADAVAAEILRGIEKKSFAIAPGLEMTLLARLHSLFGGAINSLLDREVAKVRAGSIGKR